MVLVRRQPGGLFQRTGFDIYRSGGPGVIAVGGLYVAGKDGQFGSQVEVGRIGVDDDLGLG
nr:hypothetical protein [Propionispora sp. 2/2-37]